MNVYNVYRKSDGALVGQYEYSEPIDQSAWPFATHDHVLYVPPVVVPPRTAPVRVTKLQFIERLGDPAFNTILQMAKQDVAVEAFMQKFFAVTSDPDGTSVDLTDQRTIDGVTDIGAALVQLGVVTSTWADEVLNG